MRINDCKILFDSVLLEPREAEDYKMVGEKKIIFSTTESSYLNRDLFNNKARIVKLSDSILDAEIQPGEEVIFLRFGAQEIILEDNDGADKIFLLVPVSDIICKISDN